MRSEFVTRAAGPITNRFLLMHVSAALTRKFHRPSKDRLPETINNSLAGLAEGKFIHVKGVLCMGVPDLDCYNGITGEGQYSYVKPEFLTPDLLAESA